MILHDSINGITHAYENIYELPTFPIFAPAPHIGFCSW